jgi:hypothetical protein|tara:strand:+ start:31096 stop:31233 length:138 start_codon:yes stop_codon:yes gene_type:complete
MRALSAGLKPGFRVEERPVDVDVELDIEGKDPFITGALFGMYVSK